MRKCGLLLFILLTLSSVTFAAENGSGLQTANGTTLSFAPPDTDQSQGFLYSLFGSVDGVLHGFNTGISDNSAGELAGEMLGLFNSAVLFLGGLVVLYTLIVSTLNTAHEGEVMGKQWHSIWIPVRSALGIALLLPKASGFNLIQIFMMWIIAQGIGVADSLWSNTIDAMTLRSTVLVPPQLPPSDAVNPASAILAGQVCMITYNNLYGTGKKNITFRGPFYNKSGEGHYSFKSDDGHYCGGVEWQTGPDNGVNTAVADGVAAMYNALLPTAIDLADSADPNGTQPGALNRAVFLYQQIVQQAVDQTVTVQSPSNDQVIEQAKRDGWVSAGRYYYSLAKLNDAIAQTVPSLYGQAPDDTTFSDHETQGMINSGSLQSTEAYIEDEQGNFSAYQHNTASVQRPNFDFGEVHDKVGRKVWRDFSWGMTNVMNDWYDSFANQANKNTNPIIVLQGLGNDMLNEANDTWLKIEGVIAGQAGGKTLGAITEIFSKRVGRIISTMADALGDVLSWWTPILTAVLGFIMLAGAFLAVYLPLIPFILFFFGTLAWLIGTIEAMIAAPVVALGVLSPEGHTIAGKATPAILILVNAFLRPALMIVGLIFGMMLGYVGMELLNAGFSTFVGTIFTGKWHMFQSVATVVIYTGMAVVMLQQCFSLIHKLPDRVMRWIGHHETFGGETAREGEQAVAGMASRGQAAHEKANSAALTPMRLNFQQPADKGKAEKPPEAPGAGSGDITLHS